MSSVSINNNQMHLSSFLSESLGVNINRLSMFYELTGIKQRFLVQMSKLSIEEKEHIKYIYCMFSRRSYQALDRSSQIICYHYLRGFDPSVTSTVTSLSEDKIGSILNKRINDFLVMIDTYDYQSLIENYQEEKRFIDDIRAGRTDCKMVQLYGEEVAVVKNMRLIINHLFDK